MAATSPDLLSEGTGWHGEHHMPDLCQSFVQTSETTTNPPESTRDLNQNGVLTKQLIQDGFTQLGFTTGGTTIAFLNLSLQNCSLSDISLITSYPFIQRLDLSFNRLKGLESLSNLPNLCYLDVSNNKITKILDFAPPSNLQEVDYSQNEVEEIPQHLSQYTSITKLILDGNQITELKGLKHLSCLTYLSVADNRIDKIDGLENLPLRVLNLAGNNISYISNIHTLKLLQILNLSGNQINTLKGLSGFDFLQDINLEENQIIELDEIHFLQNLCQLSKLNLKKNPIQALPNYKQYVIYDLKHLTHLDEQKISLEEKVCVRNRYRPSIDVIAAQNHMQHTSKSARKQTRLRFSTLTQLDEPYPMLVLCGPNGSGKELYTQLLVEEFPSFFGLGVSHTTRGQGPNESHGRDYYFISETTFNRAADAGEFIQTCKISGQWYGLTMAAIEQVAQQGLACVCHMTIEGVLTLKQSHFEPRYILTIPLTKQIHEERLKSTDNQLNKKEILETVKDIHLYQKYHQERPGFFDATINTDNLNEGYNILRTIVMAYGGISPETPLTLSLSASHPTSTSFSSFEIPDDNNTTMPTTAITSMLLPQEVTMSKSAPTTIKFDHMTTDHVIPDGHHVISSLQSHILAQSWSRPSSSGNRGSGHKIRKTSSDSVDLTRKEKQLKPIDNGELYLSGSSRSASLPGSCQGISKDLRDLKPDHYEELNTSQKKEMNNEEQDE